jgi:hypothetical protein
MLRIRNMAIAQMSIRLASRFKGHSDGEIRAKRVAIRGRDTDTAESVKHLACESDGDEIHPTYF